LNPYYTPWPASQNELIQVSLYENDRHVKAHMHNFIEVVYIAKGSCLHKYHNTQVNLIPGDVFIVLPHEEHSYFITARTVIYNCLFYPNALGEEWEELKSVSSVFDMLMVEPFYREETQGQNILHLSPSEAAEVESILKKMMEEQENQYTGRHLMQKAYLLTLLTLLGRSWQNQFVGQQEIYHHKRRMLVEALQHIEEHMGDELNVEKLAGKVYMSPAYFRRVFKEVTGLTPIDYINKTRISMAVSLLEKGELTVTQIAEKVGIQDVNYFSRLFRSTMGCSPTAYQKKNDLC
jgi:AraC-like DNA-binding protein